MHLVLLTTIFLVSSDPTSDIRLFERGRSQATGILVNRTVGQVPGTLPDPSRPTLVVVHGLNPMHPWVRTVVAERYAESLAAQKGNSTNVLAWDWNAAAPLGVTFEADQHRAIDQGNRLAEALVRSGLDPGSIHLIGQSTGCTVAAIATRHYYDLTGGRRIGELTLLDPVGFSHAFIFDKQAVGSVAGRVNHFWVPGASGFGKPAQRPGVADLEVRGPRQWRGWINPFKSDHMHAVRWHIGQVSR